LQLTNDFFGITTTLNLITKGQAIENRCLS